MSDQEWMKKPELIEHLSRLFGVVPPRCEELLFEGLDWRNTEIWVRDRLGQEGPVHELLDKAPAVHQLKIECSEPNKPIVLFGIGRLSDSLSELDKFGLEVSVPQAETYFERKGFSRRKEPSIRTVSDDEQKKSSGRPREKFYTFLLDDVVDYMIQYGDFENQKEFSDWVFQRAMDLQSNQKFKDCRLPGRTKLQSMFKEARSRLMSWRERFSA